MQYTNVISYQYWPIKWKYLLNIFSSCNLKNKRNKYSVCKSFLTPINFSSEPPQFLTKI